jgi:hypothetical protein
MIRKIVLKHERFPELECLVIHVDCSLAVVEKISYDIRLTGCIYDDI